MPDEKKTDPRSEKHAEFLCEVSSVLTAASCQKAVQALHGFEEVDAGKMLAAALASIGVSLRHQKHLSEGVKMLGDIQVEIWKMVSGMGRVAVKLSEEDRNEALHHAAAVVGLHTFLCVLTGASYTMSITDDVSEALDLIHGKIAEPSEEDSQRRAGTPQKAMQDIATKVTEKMDESLKFLEGAIGLANGKPGLEGIDLN